MRKVRKKNWRLFLSGIQRFSLSYMSVYAPEWMESCTAFQAQPPPFTFGATEPSKTAMSLDNSMTKFWLYCFWLFYTISECDLHLSTLRVGALSLHKGQLSLDLYCLARERFFIYLSATCTFFSGIYGLSSESEAVRTKAMVRDGDESWYCRANRSE